MLAGDGELFAGSRPAQGDIERGDLAESVSAMKSVDANIRRGREALAKALTERTSVHRAMHRTGMGWVDFVWGSEGTVKPSGKTMGAMGLAHILEARQRKDGMTEKDVSRLLDDIVQAIAKGRVVRRDTANNSETVVVGRAGVEAILTRRDGSNTWLLSGWKTKEPSSANGAGSVAPTATIARPTTARPSKDEGSDATVTPQTETNRDVATAAETDPAELTGPEREAYERWANGPAGTNAAEVDYDDLPAEDREAIDRVRVDRSGIASRLAVEQGNADADGRRLREAVDKVLAGAGIEVEYHRGHKALPASVRRGLESRLRQRGGKGRTTGLFLRAMKDSPGRERDRTILFTDALTQPREAAFTAAHEVAGHYGLAKLFKDKAALHKALDIAAQNPTVQKVMASTVRQRNLTPDQRYRAIEEAPADIAAALRTGDWANLQRRHKLGEVPAGMRSSVRAAIDNFIRRLRALLGKAGTDFTDAQVRQLLENAWQAAKGKGNTATIRNSDGTYEQVVFHGSASGEKNVRPRMGGVFDGVFASSDVQVARSHGEVVTRYDIDDNKIASHADISYRGDYDVMRDVLLREVPGLKEGTPEFDEVWNAVIEDDGSVPGDGILGESSADSSWEAQRIRGRVASALGYQAVAMNDEHGVSYLVLPPTEPEAVLESVGDDGGAGEESMRVPPNTARWMGYTSATVAADWGQLAARHPEYYSSAAEAEAEVRRVLEKPDGWYKHADGRIAIVRRGKSDEVPSVRIDFRSGPNGLRVASVYRMPWQQVARKMRDFWKRVDSGQSGYAVSGSVSPGSLSIADYLKGVGNRSQRPTQSSDAITESDGSLPQDASPIDDSILESVEYTPDQEAFMAKAGLGTDTRGTLRKLRDWMRGTLPDVQKDALIQGAVDQYYALKQAVDGKGIDIENDPYVAARMINIASTMEAVLRFGAPKMDGGVLRVDRSIPGLFDALTPVHDRLPAFFGWMVARRKPGGRLLPAGRSVP